MNMFCRLGWHKMQHFTHLVDRKGDKAFIYSIYKCKRCWRTEETLIDVQVTDKEDEDDS